MGGGGGAAGRRAHRPETGGGGMWRGGRGKAERTSGREGGREISSKRERAPRKTKRRVREEEATGIIYVLCLLIWF